MNDDLTMAGTPAFVDGVVERGGFPRSKAQKIANAGMASGWLPKSSPGGGKKGTAHWGLGSGAAYVIGLCSADPTTAFGAIVPFFAAAEFKYRERECLQEENGTTVRRRVSMNNREYPNALSTLAMDGFRWGGIAAYVDQGDFSQVLQRLLILLADGHLTEEVIVNSNIQIVLTLASPTGPRVSIHFDLPNGDSIMDLYSIPTNMSLPPELAANFGRCAVSRQSAIGYEMLLILADLLRDSMDRTGRDLLLPDVSAMSRGIEEGAVSPETTPSDNSSEDEPTAAKRGHTTNQSSLNNCEPTVGECVCPGEESGLGLTAPPERTQSDDREWNRLAAA